MEEERWVEILDGEAARQQIAQIPNFNYRRQQIDSLISELHKIAGLDGGYLARG